MEYHKPVLLAESLEFLQVSPGDSFIDATLGDAGHTIEILKQGGKVLGFEVDSVALERATARIESQGLIANFVGVNENFKNIDTIAHQMKFDSVNGIIFDLGYSSYQLDDAQMGLTFLQDQPLDMRLDKKYLSVTAADLVNMLPEKQLSALIRGFSDEKFANKIAHAIVERRKVEKLQTTMQLKRLIESATSPGYEHGRINPATRTFQALRIAVNDELGNLETSLPRAARLLLPGGRMLVISFHSLEDKVVKDFGHSAQPMFNTLTKKPVIASENEVRENNRSRSAKLRVFEKSK